MSAAPRPKDTMRVARLDLWIDPAFDADIGREPGLALQVLPAHGDAVTAAGLAGAHAYHVSAAKDEVPARWQVSESLLAACPQLLCVSSGGAGYDTVNVKDCTAAGIIVVNQSGGNREAVAQHVLGMLLCLSKRIIETDRALRRGTLTDRNQAWGRETQGRTIGIIGLGNVGSRVAQLTGTLLGMQVLACDPYLPADEIARRGATPLIVTDGALALGVIELKDIVKSDIKERFAEMRAMGIKTIMITGDNPLTAAAIAAEAGVDDFLAEATPEAKLGLIREIQAENRLVAMCGDGTNDAPALAQADVAVAMNTGTQAAKEAGNMVDLDSNPTKLIEVVEIGKQMLITRGSLTTFSISNDIAKYFAIIPAAFATTYPALNTLNVMRLATPQSAILSAVIFNALIIIFLIPLALKGVKYRALGAGALLRRNLLVYGLGGIVVPFIGIKLIDMLLVLCGLA